MAPASMLAMHLRLTVRGSTAQGIIAVEPWSWPRAASMRRTHAPRACRIISGKAHAVGDEITITYGPMRNDELLMYYGFLDEISQPPRLAAIDHPKCVRAMHARAMLVGCRLPAWCRAHGLVLGLRRAGRPRAAARCMHASRLRAPRGLRGAVGLLAWTLRAA